MLNDDDELWQCIADQGDLKVYKRELEENGIVIDPVKAVCTVKVCAVDSGIVIDPVKAVCTVKVCAVDSGIVIDPVKAVCTVKVCAWASTLTLSKLFAL